MDTEAAGKVYDVLVQEAGASDDEYARKQFVHKWSQPGEQETRFKGLLGLGGKVWRVDKFRIVQPFTTPLQFEPSYGVYVDCYPEDMTPERAEIIERVNKQLAGLLS